MHRGVPAWLGAGHLAGPSSTEGEGFAMWIQGQSLLLLLTLSGWHFHRHCSPCSWEELLEHLCNSKEVTKCPISIFLVKCCKSGNNVQAETESGRGTCLKLMGLMQQDMKQPELVLACLYGVTQVGQGGLFSWRGVTNRQIYPGGSNARPATLGCKEPAHIRIVNPPPALYFLHSFWLSL